MFLRRLPILFLLGIITVSLAAQEAIPRDSVPEDHLAWLGFRGPVKEVRVYNYGYYGKTVYRFDPHGRLLEYIDYMTPFAGSGGCVFGLWEHFRYAYDENGKIIFLETYNEENNVVDDYADLILELFPKQNKEADLFPKAEKEFGDTTYCWSIWSETEDLMHYHGRRFDKYGNWIEDVSASEDDYDHADVIVREISYYRDIEAMGLPVGVKTVTHKTKSDGKTWSNRYDFDREGNLLFFQSWCDKEALFEWEASTAETPGSDLIVWEPDGDKSRKITYWK
jgi:hypothetical protein